MLRARLLEPSGEIAVTSPKSQSPLGRIRGMQVRCSWGCHSKFAKQPCATRRAQKRLAPAVISDLSSAIIRTAEVIGPANVPNYVNSKTTGGMDLSDQLAQLAARIPKQIDLLETEEATKNALVMPLLNALGYNVFDPTEVVPEFTADVGLKKGEKVDYVVLRDGKPSILIECKAARVQLATQHASQLYRYFSVTDARFAILTNGIQYQFYTDIESPNRMDEKPFFEIDMLKLTAREIEELKKFAKPNFDLQNILSNASELKYKKQIMGQFAQELASPSEELVRMLTKRVYSGMFTPAVKEQFSVLVGDAFRSFVREAVNSRIQTALEGGSQPHLTDEPPPGGSEADEADDGIVTTADEIEGFHIVRALLSRHVAPERVVMRDTKAYCGVLLDDNNRKPICRLRFNYSQKYVSLLDENKEEERIPISTLADIYDLAPRLIATALRYDSRGESEAPDSAQPEAAPPSVEQGVDLANSTPPDSQV